MTHRKKLVALTGDGISVESGLATHRHPGGAYEQYDVMDLVSIDGWRKNPELVQCFYNDRRKQLGEVEPNVAHRILAELEKDFDVTVITQNVDNLHEQAGSTRIIHLYGELTKARSSLHADMVFDIGYRAIEPNEKAPDGSPLRPHVVWFGEQVRMIEAAQAVVATADILLIVGSSLTVYPAAELVKHANAGASVYLISPNEVKYAGRNITMIRDKATSGMEKLKKILLQIPKETPNDGKTNIYNVMILDQSGSMQSIKQEAINGYNETLQTIKVAQQQHADTQNHFVTLVVFNGSATNMAYDRVACTGAAEMTNETYQPDSNTPLYDAMGTTLSKFRHLLDTSADNEVLVTVITDGQENASKEYTGQQIHQMVTELKALGWVFTYIGANHNVEEAAKSMGIHHALAYESTRRGTKEMFEKQSARRKRFYDKIATCDDIVARKKMIANDRFFDDEDEDSSKKS